MVITFDKQFGLKHIKNKNNLKWDKKYVGPKRFGAL